MNYETQANRESLARWQERKAEGGIQPGDNFHWTPYPSEPRDKNGDVRFRCAICNKPGSNDKMRMVEVVFGGKVRCWDAEVIATFPQTTQDEYAENTLADGSWNLGERGYMGWWFVGSECAKHLHPSLLPPKELQDRVRAEECEDEKQRAEKEKERRAI